VEGTAVEPSPTTGPTSQVLGPGGSPDEGVSGLPSTGLADGNDEGGWSPWMIAGLALAMSGAALSLGAKLLRVRSHARQR
jgi:hypothetical protein